MTRALLFALVVIPLFLFGINAAITLINFPSDGAVYAGYALTVLMVLALAYIVKKGFQRFQ